MPFVRFSRCSKPGSKDRFNDRVPRCQNCYLTSTCRYALFSTELLFFIFLLRALKIINIVGIYVPRWPRLNLTLLLTKGSSLICLLVQIRNRSHSKILILKRYLLCWTSGIVSIYSNKYLETNNMCKLFFL